MEDDKSADAQIEGLATKDEVESGFREGKFVSVSDLIRDCRAASERLSKNHPHKWLILSCALAMSQLAERLYAVEHPDGDAVQPEEVH